MRIKRLNEMASDTIKEYGYLLEEDLKFYNIEGYKGYNFSQDEEFLYFDFIFSNVDLDSIMIVIGHIRRFDLDGMSKILSSDKREEILISIQYDIEEKEDLLDEVKRHKIKELNI